MSLMRLSNISKTYRRGDRAAVEDVSLEVGHGELLALVGESGSGKTTLLRLMAGLETPDHGEIYLGDEVLSTPRSVVPPEKRRLGLIFQQHALFPHRTVEKNIDYGLRKLSSQERKQEVAEWLQRIGLAKCGQRYPHELSGGERQRVALARALAPRPEVLLMDEPFSSLDTQLRLALREETREILQESNASAVLVTHDTRDALAFADRIALLRHGHLQQVDAPQAIYNAPVNAYVAAFFGRCNFLPLDSLPHPSGARIHCHIGPPAVTEGNRMGLWVRPEDLELGELASAPGDALVGTVTRVRFGGDGLDVTLRCQKDGGAPFHVLLSHRAPVMVKAGEKWAVLPKPRTNPL